MPDRISEGRNDQAQAETAERAEAHRHARGRSRRQFFLRKGSSWQKVTINHRDVADVSSFVSRQTVPDLFP